MEKNSDTNAPTLDEAIQIVADLVFQYGYRMDYHGKPALYDGGLSAGVCGFDSRRVRQFETFRPFPYRDGRFRMRKAPAGGLRRGLQIQAAYDIIKVSTQGRRESCQNRTRLKSRKP